MRTYLAGFACLLIAAGRISAAEPVDYLRQVKPILAERCFTCHGSLRQRSGLRLDAAGLIREGGDNGPAIEAGSSGDSLLIDAVTGGGDIAQMPPEEEGAPLDEQQIALLKAWIDQGAVAPDEAVPPDPRRHWAYQPPVQQPPPQVDNAAWQRHPIDAFLAAAHEQNGVTPRSPASKEVLLRRLYLDLVGLPPTPQERHAFLADPAEDAYEVVVDRLLASPRYGERWGRHWMDIWRYSDWFGLGKEVRYSQKHIWHWRDWIVESLNRDKGYDRMIVEMLAGDELAPADPETVRATGFLARNWYLFNRNYWLDDVIEHTSKAFLGVTLNCTRCHEHKYDPISQTEYYRFRAFFEPHAVRLDPMPGQSDLEKAGLPRVYDKDAEAPTFRFVRGNEESPDKQRPLRPAVPTVLGELADEIEVVHLPLAAYYPGLSAAHQQAALAAAEADVERTEAQAKQARSALAQLDTAGAEQPGAASSDLQSTVTAAERTVVLSEQRIATARLSLVAVRARLAAENAKHAASGSEEVDELAQAAAQADRNAAVATAELDVLLAEDALAAARHGEKPDDEKSINASAAAEKRLGQAKKTLAAATTALNDDSPTYTPFGKLYPRTSTGRRLALARWIADRKNPLTARVAVNHIWTRYFGSPLVGSMFDFGLRTKRPIHSELLDWLAVELMERSWSMKELHRLIVTSSAYRMQSAAAGADDPNLKIDPDNRFFWRMNPRRMEGEIVRDSLLHLVGELDPTMGGPALPVAAAENGTRRTIYYRYARDDRIKFLTLFDPPSVEECYRRHDSIVPQQALAMSNSKMVLSRGRQLAAIISREVAARDTTQSTAVFITSAFERILGRGPTPAEQAACAAALDKFAETPTAKAKAPDTRQRARENLIHVLLNHNDFITIR